MRIVFLSGCLEPGHDGVGDYTRLLAAELISQGHVVTAISLNDKYVSDVLTTNQQINNIVVNVLRLPSVIQFKDRLKKAKEYIDEFDPDWISLQFVIFGYHPKGLPFGIGKNIAALGIGRQWHIMFHELWIGMQEHATKKHIVWGKLQRLLIKNLLKKLKPKIIHTQTGLYQQQIKKLGYTAQHLPLFGNIPKAADYGKRSKVIFTEAKVENIRLVIFGNIFSGSPLEDFANEAASYIKENTISIQLTFVGRCGNEQAHWAEKCSAAGISVTILGEQPVTQVSQVLGNATIGISTYPSALVEKSGSVAAMLEHGLSVICVQPNWHPKGFKKINLPIGVKIYEKGNLKSILTNECDLSSTNNISVTAHKLADALLSSI